MSLRYPRWGLPPFKVGEQDPIVLYRQMLANYGRNLSDTDPRALVLRSVAAILVQSNVATDNAVKGSLLPYAEGEELDYIGALYGAPRLPATPASVVVTFALSAQRAIPTFIDEGTRVAAGNVVFATETELRIDAGQLTGDVRAVALEIGTAGNNVLDGEINTLVDQNNPYVDNVTNTNAATGGSAEELDDAYAERLRLLPETFSVAGPIGAYEYWARAWSPAVTDVYISTPNRRDNAGQPPEPGIVRIYALVNAEPIDGSYPRIPSDNQTDAADMWRFIDGDTVRPDTDDLYIESPAQVSRSWKLDWYPEPNEDRGTNDIQADVDAAVEGYIEWQQGAIGRSINPDELVRRLRDNAGIQYVVEASGSTDPFVFEALAPTEVPLMTITTGIGS